jgi:hypothetical protein
MRRIHDEVRRHATGTSPAFGRVPEESMTTRIRVRSYLLGAALAAMVWGTVPVAQTLTHENQGGSATAAAGAATQHDHDANADPADAQKLDDLVARMNAARGSAKVDRIADVVNELVAQHKREHEAMAAMMRRMHPAEQVQPAPETRNPHEH